MDPQLPKHLEHLQRLLDEVPESHKHYGRLHMRRDYLKVERPKNGENGVPRPCRYWSAATGNEIDVELHPPTGRTAAMIATLEKQTGPVLLGRAPDFPQNHFRQWHDDKEEFGWDEDGDYDEDYDKYLVVKSVKQPDWVDEVKRGAKYRDVIEGKQTTTLEHTDSAAADESDGDIGDIPYEEQPDDRIPPRHTARSRSDRSRHATRSSSTWYDSENDSGEIVASDAEEPIGHASATPAGPTASVSRAPAKADAAKARRSRFHGKSRPTRPKKLTAIGGDDDDTTMPDGGPEGHTSVEIDSSELNDLLIHFKAKDPIHKPRTCRWGICHEVSDLFDHALLGGVVNREDDLRALWVAVKTSGKDVRGSPFGITKTDVDTFGELGSALERIAKSGGLKRTTVEVTRA